jgi:hypothetical protein
VIPDENLDLRVKQRSTIIDKAEQKTGQVIKIGHILGVTNQKRRRDSRILTIGCVTGKYARKS